MSTGSQQAVDRANQQAAEAVQYIKQFEQAVGEKEGIDPEILEQWAQLRMGHEGMMLDKIQRQNRIVEDTVKAQQQQAGYESTVDGDDEMGVSIGNKTYNIQPVPQQPQVIQAPTAQKPDLISKIATPLAVMAAGAMTGGGAWFGLAGSQAVPAAVGSFTEVTGAFGKPVDVIKAPDEQTKTWKENLSQSYTPLPSR